MSDMVFPSFWSHIFKSDFLSFSFIVFFLYHSSSLRNNNISMSEIFFFFFFFFFFFHFSFSFFFILLRSWTTIFLCQKFSFFFPYHSYFTSFTFIFVFFLFLSFSFFFASEQQYFYVKNFPFFFHFSFSFFFFLLLSWATIFLCQRFSFFFFSFLVFFLYHSSSLLNNNISVSKIFLFFFLFSFLVSFLFHSSSFLDRNSILELLYLFLPIPFIQSYIEVRKKTDFYKQLFWQVWPESQEKWWRSLIIWKKGHDDYSLILSKQNSQTTTKEFSLSKCCVSPKRRNIPTTSSFRQGCGFTIFKRSFSPHVVLKEVPKFLSLSLSLSLNIYIYIYNARCFCPFFFYSFLTSLRPSSMANIYHPKDGL